MAKFYTNLSLENYKRAMSGEYQGISPENISTINDNDISVQDNIKNAISVANTAVTDDNANHDSDPAWYEKIGNFFGTIFHGIQEGVLNFVDGIGDFAMGTIGAIGGALGNKELEQTMTNAMQYDWQSQVIQAGDAISGTVWNAGRALVDPNYDWEDYQKEYTDIASAENSRENLNNEKYGTDISDGVMDTISGVSQGIGQMLPNIALAGGIGSLGSSLGASANAIKAATVTTQATIGAMQGTASGFNKATNQGATLSQSAGYAYTKGLMGGAKSALISTIGGTITDNAQNAMGEAVATKVLGATGKQALANFAGSITSIATDVAIDSGLDFAEELLDPVIATMYDSNAIANAYADDNWKTTLANAGKVALTSALTSFIVDSAKAVTGQRRTNFADQAQENLEVEATKKTIKQARKEMRSKGDDETLSRMQDLDDQAKANLETIKNDVSDLQKAQNEYGKNNTEENKAKVDEVAQRLRTDVQKADEIAETIVQKSKDYIDINNKIVANDDSDTNTAQANVRDRKIIEAKYERERLKRSAYEEAIKKYDSDIEAYNKRKAEAQAKGEEFTESKPKKPQKKYSEWAYLGDNIKAKIDFQDNKIVYKADNVTNTNFLLKNSFNDDLNGRKVIINKDYVNTKTDLQVDTSKVTAADIESLSNTLIDTTANYSTTYVNPDTKDTIIKSTNGNIYSFKNGVYEGMINQMPQWATDQTVQLYETRSSYYENDMRLIQQASTISHIGEKDVYDFIDNRVEQSGFKVKENGASWTRKTATAYNLAKTENERSQVIEGAVKQLLDNGTLEANYKDDNGKIVRISVDAKTALTETDLETLKTDLKNMLDSNQKYTPNQKMTTEYRTNLLRLSSDLNKLQRATDNMIAQRKAFDTLQNKIKRAGTKSTPTNQPYEKINPYILQYGSLKIDSKTGNVSTESLGRLFKGGVLESMDENGQKTNVKINYTLDDLRKYGLEDLFDQNTADIIDEISSHFNDNGEYTIATTDENGNEVLKASNTLSLEDNEAITGILKRISRMSSASDTKIRTERKQKYMTLLMASEGLQYGNPTRSGVGRRAQRIVNSTLGLSERFNIYFGKGSKAYQILVTEPQLDRQQSALKKNELLNDMSVFADQHHINLNTKGSENVTFEYNGETYNLKKGEVMSLYLNSLSPDNLAKLTTDGWTTNNKGTNVKHNAVDNNFFDFIKDNVLSADEVGFVDDLFSKGYNGRTKDTLNKYTDDKYNLKLFNEENYVHRSISGVEQTGSFENMIASSFRNKAKNLDAGIATKRNGNRGAMNIGDIFLNYDSYCEQVADFVSLDHIRELNTAMNMRGSQDYVSDENGNPINQSTEGEEQYQRAYAPTSIYSNFGLVDGGKDFIETWMKAVNGMNVSNTSKAMKIFQNAAAAPIGFNPGTYLKMFLDPIRFVGKEVTLADGTIKRIGWKNVFEGLINSFNSATRDGTLEKYSTYWAKANQDRYAISSSVYGAQFSGLKNKIFYEPLEHANNAMMKHVAFPTLQSFAKSISGESIGSETNTKIALELFDTLSVTTLSNGDSLDVSDLRSGRSGNLLQAVFGMYGGDSQKKTEQVFDVFLGNSRSKRRVVGYEHILNKYSQVQDEYKARIDEAQERLDRVNTRYLENKATDFDVLMAENNVKDAQAQYDAIKGALEDTQKNIDFEKNVVQSKSSQLIKAGYVASIFVVSAIIESSINVLTDVLKNKDDEVNAEEFLKDVGEGALIDWIPYIGTIANSVQYASNGDVDLTPLQLQGLASTISAGKGLFELIGQDNSTIDYSSAIYKAVEALGTNMGIPIKNLMDYFVGATTRVNEWTGGNAEWAANWRTMIRGYNSSTLTTKAKTFIEQGNLTKATEYTQANMAFFKTGNVSWELAKELAKTQASVSSAPDELTGTSKDNFMKIYNKSNGVAEKYIKKQEYKSLSDEDKGKALSQIYKGYYYLSKAITYNDEELLQGSLSKALYAYYSGMTITAEQRKLLKKYGII